MAKYIEGTNISYVLMISYKHIFISFTDKVMGSFTDEYTSYPNIVFLSKRTVPYMRIFKK